MDFHDLVCKLKELAKDKGKTPTLREFEASGVSKRQIVKHQYNKIVAAAGLDPNRPSSFAPIEPVIRPPKILYFDIEVSDMTVKTYNLKNDYISPKKIVKDWHFLSYAGFFEGEEEKVFYLDQRFAHDVSDDRQLIEGLHDLLSSADILVGHNIDRFDIKKFNARAIFYELPPLKHIQTYDTLKIAKRIAAFTSNSLWYLANYFKLDVQKSEHGKFPGDELWNQCLDGNMEAWEECEAYNKQDCVVTQALFKKLCSYDPRINVQSFYYAPTCICGGKEFKKDGFKYTKFGKFQVRRCNKCSKTFTERTNLIDKDLRQGFYQ